MESKRIYHVHLRDPFRGKRDYYFGSIVAIYATLPEAVLGIGYHAYLSKRLNVFENAKCRINVDNIIRNVRHGKST